MAPAQQARRWVHIQSDTFRRWINSVLQQREMSITDLYLNLRDGVALINLVELLEEKSVVIRHNSVPMNLEQCEFNVKKLLEHLETRRALRFPIDVQSVLDGDPPTVLALVWSLILFYKFEGSFNAWSFLRGWVNSQIGVQGQYKLPARNFTTDWQDGRRICALVDSFSPGLIEDATSERGDAFMRAKMGITMAFEVFAIPPILAVEDMVHPELDELSVMTYLSVIFEAMQVRARREQALLDEGAEATAASVRELDFLASDEALEDDCDDASSSHSYINPGSETPHQAVYEEDFALGLAPPPPPPPRPPSVPLPAVQPLPVSAVPPPPPLPPAKLPPAYELVEEALNTAAIGASDDGRSDDSEDSGDEHSALIPPPPPAPPLPPSTLITPTARRSSARASLAGLEVRVTGGPASCFALDEGKNFRRGLSYVPLPGAVTATPEATYLVHVAWRGTAVPGSPFAVDASQLPPGVVVE